MNKGTIVLCLHFLFLFSAVSIYAEEDLTVKAGVCLLEYTGDREQALAGGVSSRLYELIEGISEHRVGGAEKSVLYSREKEEKIREKSAAVENLYNERDQLIFKTRVQDLAGELNEIDTKIQKAAEELEILRAEKKSLLDDIADEDEILILETSRPSDGTLFRRKSGPIEETAAVNGLDIVVYGFIETIDQYEYIEIRIWDNLLKEDRFVWRTAVDAGNVNDLIEPGLRAVKTDLLGRDWSEITVRGPDNSLIYIDGVFAGIGSINRFLVEPGTIEIELKKNGCESRKEIIKPEAFGHFEYEFELTQIKTETFIVQTRPAEADVYLDSVWAGITPIRLELKNEKSAVKISKEGYEENVFFISPEDGNMVEIDLRPLSIGREEWVPDARKRFYTSMGSFLLSVPLTSMFSNMINQSASAYQRETAANGQTNVDELLRLFYLNRAEYALYLASLGLNVFLFLDTIIKAVDYVGGVDYFSK